VGKSFLSDCAEEGSTALSSGVGSLVSIMGDGVVWLATFGVIEELVVVGEVRVSWDSLSLALPSEFAPCPGLASDIFASEGEET